MAWIRHLDLRALDFQTVYAGVKLIEPFWQVVQDRLPSTTNRPGSFVEVKVGDWRAELTSRTGLTTLVNRGRLVVTRSQYRTANEKSGPLSRPGVRPILNKDGIFLRTARL